MMLALPEPRIAMIKRVYLYMNKNQPKFKQLTKKINDSCKYMSEKEFESVAEKDVDEIAFI